MKIYRDKWDFWVRFTVKLLPEEIEMSYQCLALMLFTSSSLTKCGNKNAIATLFSDEMAHHFCKWVN